MLVRLHGSGFFQHGHTYMGHPMACAAGLAVQETIRRDNLLANVRTQGALLREGIQVVIAGQPNAGKSSLLNALTNRSSLARTSNTPGRTQELNFFDVGNPVQFRLVDMPGYGYAAAAKTKVASWTALIHKFLLGRATLARVYVLIDARHGIKDVDLDVLKTLDKSAVSYQVVLTKADKIKASEKGAEELTNAQVERYLELEAIMKIISAAVKKTAFNRLQHGATFEKWKPE